MQIKVNGVNEEIKDGLSICDFLALKNIKIGEVAIELNKAIVSKDKYHTVSLKNNDSLEIVRFVGGG